MTHPTDPVAAMREACVKHVADAIAACYRRAWTSPDEMRGATGALKRLAVSMANLPLPSCATGDDAAHGEEAKRELAEAWTQNSCGDKACEEHRLAAALYVLRGNKTHREAAQLVLGADDYPDHATPAPSRPADDASGAEAMRDDICKGCSTYEWCSVTGACLADSDPHDEGDWRRVVSTLTALAPLPPTADAVERARREEAYAKTFGQMLARDICESEPSGAVIDAQDRLKGTEAETFLVIDPRDLAEWVQRNVSNAFYDGEITIAAEREAGRDGKGE